jgi:hypothetical protein
MVKKTKGGISFEKVAIKKRYQTIGLEQSGHHHHHHHLIEM